MAGTIQLLVSRDVLQHYSVNLSLKLAYHLVLLPSMVSIGSLTLSHKHVCMSVL